MNYHRSFTGQDTQAFGKLYGYKKLLAWQVADELAAVVHDLTGRFPSVYTELRAQMLKAAGSTPDNIAEGYCRNALGDYIRFCEIARGSLGELGSQIQRCERWHLLQDQPLTHLLGLYSDATYYLEQLIKSLYAKRNEGTWNRDLAVRESSGSYDISPFEPIELPEDLYSRTEP
ncbi:MAG: four helix bundle protein [Anaerolineae bacterium]|nr:four helix bundle protein [Anaerolineae bacterium]